jgi:hypothetical protein
MASPEKIEDDAIEDWRWALMAWLMEALMAAMVDGLWCLMADGDGLCEAVAKVHRKDCVESHLHHEILLNLKGCATSKHKNLNLLPKP